MEGLWTIPWGRLEDGESPSSAALREVEEESGIIARVDGLVGMQELPEPWLGWFALIYHYSHVEGKPQPDHRETDAADYFTIEQLDELDEPIEPWSKWLMRRVLNKEHSLAISSVDNPYNPKAGFL